MKLIDKDAVLAIIEKFIYGANIEADIASTGECFDEKVADAKYQLCKCIKGKIDTLEVKEIQEFPVSYKQSPVVLYGLTGSVGNTKEEPQVKESAEIERDKETCKENGDSLTREPVNEVWHNMSEEAENGRNIIIIDPKNFYGAVLRKGGSQLRNHNKERYVKWAYIDDLQNFSNIERTVKNWKEPVSEDLEEAADNALSNVLNTHEIVNVRSCLEMFRLGAKWQKKRDYIPLSDDINEVARQICNKVLNCEIDYKEDDIVLSDEEECVKAGIRWQMQKESIPSKDLLEELINNLSKRYPEVSFAKLSRIAVRVAKWKVENLWKPADGDDLPEIDREVIALLDNGKVVFAHRPDPKGWDAKSIITEKVEHYTPETYGKGGWNIPDVKWWLDCSLPNMEED